MNAKDKIIATEVEVENDYTGAECESDDSRSKNNAREANKHLNEQNSKRDKNHVTISLPN